MENELSISVIIAVELLVIAVIIGSIMLFSSLGRDMGRASMQRVDDIHASTYGAELEALGEYDRPIPIASVFVLLEKNQGNIEKISGHVDGTVIDSINDLTDLYHKKVKCIVTEKNDKYIIRIEEE